MNYLIDVLLVSYVLLVFFFITFNLIIFHLKRNSTGDNEQSELNKISVLIAMKNEQDKIDNLLNALLELNYPKEKFEVVLVDDNSDDNSVERAESFSNKFDNLKIIKATEKIFPGKKGALSVGLEHCSNEFIALTDADCAPEKEWLRGVNEALQNYDVAFGIAPLKSGREFAAKFASYESGKNQIMNLAALKIGIPISATGRNFAYKKTAIESLGGYEKTAEILSGDDDLILREAYKNKLKIGFIFHERSSVFSEAPATWKEYFAQRSRHVKTSHKYTVIQKVFSFFVFFGEIVVGYSFLLFPVNYGFAFMSLLKLRVAQRNHNNYMDFFGNEVSFTDLILFEFIYPAILIINFTLSLFSKDRWK